SRGDKSDAPSYCASRGHAPLRKLSGSCFQRLANGLLRCRKLCAPSATETAVRSSEPHSLSAKRAVARLIKEGSRGFAVPAFGLSTINNLSRMFANTRVRCFSFAKLLVTIRSRACHNAEAFERVRGETPGC